jgi:hypothetical protein
MGYVARFFIIQQCKNVLIVHFVNDGGAEIFSDSENDPLQKKAKKNKKELTKRLKIGFCQKKKVNIKTTKTFIKNPSRYVFYNFDKIYQKNIIFHFGIKMTPVKIFLSNT